MPDRVTTSFEIEAPVSPEVAFAYLADVTRHGEWSPAPYWIDPAPSLPLVEGATFTSHGRIPGDKDHVNQVVVTALDPPRTFELSSEDRGQVFVHRFTVEPTEGGCRVTRTVVSPRPTGPIRLVFPLIFALLIKPDATKGMQALRARLAAL